MEPNLNILICPLEWGLGHAARMIPVARKLKARGHNILIASGNDHLDFLRKELPGMAFLEFPGFSPAYSRILPQYLILLFRIPRLIREIVIEHRELDRIIDRYSIDIVISDNRFGLWNKRVKTAYVTHMPRIPFPAPFRFLEFIGIGLHRLIIRKYSLCFIPDLPGEINLSGRLTHSIRFTANTRFIGILSRFTGDNMAAGNTAVSDRDLVILSGPEPQRTIFGNLILEALDKEERKAIVLEGKPGPGKETSRSGNFEYQPHPVETIMKHMIMTGRRIISRSGYTTLMELASLGRSALIIPTPGQTEQEYLALRLASEGWFTTVSQKKLIKGVLPSETATISIPEDFIKQSELLLDKALDELLKNHPDD